MEIQELLIDESSNIIDTMQALDKNAMKILFVTRANILVATITDGDIRRWILKQGKLDALVTEFGNYSPKFLKESEIYKAKQIFEEFRIDSIPIVNEEGEILSVLFRDNVKILKKRTLGIPVVIMAGGLGTRLYPYTRILPKALLPIDEIPISEHIINRFYEAGSNKFYLIVNYKKNMIKAYFNEIDRKYDIDFIEEDKPLGTGGGLSLLKGKLKTTFILSNCDILIEEDYEKILKFHREEKNLITMVCSVKNIKIPYGVIEIGENGQIVKMKEKPTISFFANTGMYLVEPIIVEELDDQLYMGFPDIVEHYRQSGEKIGVFPISENSWLDMGQFEEMEIMRKRIEKNE